jgi:hypothetical protein
VHYDCPREFPRDGELRFKRRELAGTRRVVVVIVQTALPDGDGPTQKLGANTSNVALGLEVRRIVRVNSRSVKAEARVPGSEISRATRRVEGFPDAHERGSPRALCAGDDLATVLIECRVGEVNVTVDPGHVRTNRRARRRFEYRIVTFTWFTERRQ